MVVVGDAHRSLWRSGKCRPQVSGRWADFANLPFFVALVELPATAPEDPDFKF